MKSALVILVSLFTIITSCKKQSTDKPQADDTIHEIENPFKHLPGSRLYDGYKHLINGPYGKPDTTILTDVACTITILSDSTIFFSPDSGQQSVRQRDTLKLRNPAGKDSFSFFNKHNYFRIGLTYYRMKDSISVSYSESSMTYGFQGGWLLHTK